MPRKVKVSVKKLPSMRSTWETMFVTKMKLYHRKNVPGLAKKMMKRLDGIKHSMVARSAKYDVDCTITVDELRQMAYDAYGTTCKYTGRVIKYENMVFDHAIPISKGGSSNIENIQVISRFANSMKGSLMEHHFQMLLEWLATTDPELSKDVSIRLAGGIR